MRSAKFIYESIPYFAGAEWPEGYRLAAQMNFHFPKFSQISLADVVPGISIEGLTLLSDMLKWNPSLRPTAFLALRYPYFLDTANVMARRKSKTVKVPSAYNSERWYEDLWRERDNFSFEKSNASEQTSKPFRKEDRLEERSVAQRQRYFNASFKDAKISRSWPAFEEFDLSMSEMDFRTLKETDARSHKQ
ncbi:hypothetical protein AVEN_93876-1 [Araneus ventricosus]|uniref:Uncharacterized protein n=1 Tax=Araneus ventricosus TaxID=182803 RepID=A0A4Y2AXS2_ARAVE|nr:hypothetical protein AVEN_93876-1 [Araneus ventricosus]